MKIFVSAGEVSGDVHAAYLVREIKKLDPNISFYGLGSEKLLAAGVDVRWDMTKRGSIGIVEVLPNIFPILSLFKKVKRSIIEEKPDLVLLVDSQGFNLPLAQFCKKIGVKTAYYIPPQEWLWGTTKGIKKVAAAVDLIIAIFEKEYEAYKSVGANVVYFGHPLLDIVVPTLSKAEARKRFWGNLFANAPIIALCPGSRGQEIKKIFPILLGAARKIQGSIPGAKFLVPLATTKLKDNIIRQIRGISAISVIGQNYDVLSCADLAICTSGTINLEASILGTPNIMVYRLNPLTYWIGKNILKIDQKMKYFSMPNILLDKQVVPELIQGHATSALIAMESVSILENKTKADGIKSDLKQLRTQLGKPGAIKKSAKAILELVS
ncbi:MAG: lipid-A-disaccharide synthase [Candidatus Margulisiibacteriota bacterium]